MRGESRDILKGKHSRLRFIHGWNMILGKVVELVIKAVAVWLARFERFDAGAALRAGLLSNGFSHDFDEMIPSGNLT